MFESYLWHRQSGATPARATVMARLDMVAGKVRHPRRPCGVWYAPRESVYPTVRWVESPEEELGLRFVCFSNDRKSYGAWYVDTDQGDTTRGVVYRLTARDGQSRYMAGGTDPYNDGPAYLEPCVYDDEDDAARAADQLAERYAETERDHTEAWQAGDHARQLGEDAETEACRLLVLLREMRPIRKAGTAPPSVCALLRRDVTTMLARIYDWREERDRLVSDWSSNDAFKEGYGS